MTDFCEFMIFTRISYLYCTILGLVPEGVDPSRKEQQDLLAHLVVGVRAQDLVHLLHDATTGDLLMDRLAAVLDHRLEHLQRQQHHVWVGVLQAVHEGLHGGFGAAKRCVEVMWRD